MKLLLIVWLSAILFFGILLWNALQGAQDAIRANDAAIRSAILSASE